MFTILNRKAAGPDKCPRCSRLNVDFVDMGEGVLGCFDCGSVFLRKAERVRSRFSVVKPEVTIVEAIEAGRQVAKDIFSEVPEIPTKVFKGVAVPPVVFTCDICGKVCKNKIGLSGHSKSHR